ncbi:MAG TPA: tetratricopeptide repeat protein [Dongiaceae bacterium]
MPQSRPKPGDRRNALQKRKKAAPAKSDLSQRAKRKLERLQQAALSGDADAQLSLANFLRTPAWKSHNPRSAANWAMKAAEQNHAEAQYFVGCCFATGEGLAKDAKEAVRWYRKAARQGHAEAQYNLGTMYWLGEGVRRNSSLARQWIAMSAEAGGILAKKLLADAYQLGMFGFPPDKALAKRWRRLAAV